MKKALKITLAVLGTLIVLLVMVPFVISWNQYRELIQQEAFKATGRQLLIKGDIRIGILPSPYARLNDVVVANPEGAKSEQFASIKSLDVGVALAPLFSKKIQVTHITISEPAITLEVMANGQNNWQFTPADKDAETAKTTPEASSASTQGFSIDDLTIEKGYVRYVDVPKQSQQMIGPIDGTFNVASLQGPVSGRGTVTVLEKLPIRFDTTIESLPSDTNKNIPFKLSLALLGNLAAADLKGIATTGDATSARVETALSVPDLEKLLAAASKDNKSPNIPDFLKGKTSVTGLLEYADSTAKMDNLMLKSGGMEVTGGLQAKTGDKTSITMDLSRVVLPPEFNSGAVPSSGKSSGSSDNLAKTLESSFQSAVKILDTALPTTPMDVVFTATQLPAPGLPALRDVRVAVSTGKDGVTIQNIETKLPGNTVIQINGKLPARTDGTIENAQINTKLTTQNMQAALGKENTASAMPINLQTTATLSRQNLRLQPLQITQNGQTVGGTVVYDPKAAQALNVAIKGSALNLDSFLGGEKAPTQKPHTSQNGVDTGGDPLASLQGLKAAVSADLDSLTYQGKTAKQVSVQALLSSDGLTLSKARIGDLGGMVIDANGKVDRLSPLKGVNLNATAQSPNLSNTLKALGNAEAANLGASQFTAALKGDTDKLDVALNGTIDQGKIAINGVAKNINTAPGFDGKIDISHPETATIVRNFAKMKPKVNLGTFGLKADVAYGSDTLKINGLDVKLGSAGSLSGHVNIIPQNNTRSIDADLRSTKLALAALMGDDTETSANNVNTSQPDINAEGWSKEAINLEALRNLNGRANIEIGELLYQKFVIKDFKTTVKFGNNLVNLEQLKGSLFDAGSFSVNGQLAPGAVGQAHRGDFTFAVIDTDAPKLFVALGSKPFSKGTLDLNQKISFNGASPYAIVSSLNGDGQIKVTDGVVNGIDLDGLAAKLDRPNSLTDFAAIINQARAGGETPIGNLDIPVLIRNGVVQVQDTQIKTKLTAMDMRGRVDLPPKQVDMVGQITFTEQRNLPPLTLNIKGPMSAPQKSFDTKAFTQFYAQKATEKLQGKVQDKLNKFLGIEKPAETAPAPETAPATETAPTTAPTAPSTAPARTEKQQREDALKQMGGQMLNNLLGGGR